MSIRIIQTKVDIKSLIFMFRQLFNGQSMEQGSIKSLQSNLSYCPFVSCRTSTVILVRRDQTGLFIEKTLRNPLENTSEWIVNTWQFQLNDINAIPFLINE